MTAASISPRRAVVSHGAAGLRRAAAAAAAPSGDGVDAERPIGGGGRRHPRFFVRSAPPRRTFAVYATGHGWTGALGVGRDAMTDGEISDGALVDGGGGGEEEGGGADGEFVEVTYGPGGGGDDATAAAAGAVTAGAAGWGHTALIVEEEGTAAAPSPPPPSGTAGGRAATAKTEEKSRTRLLVAGRPQDFQNLLRLNRLPAFVRRAMVRSSLRYDDGSAPAASGAVFGPTASRMIDAFLTSGGEEREGMVREGRTPGADEEFRYRYGILPTPTEVPLPDGDEPAARAGDGRCVLSASAGLTAVVGRRDGTLYAFGLNHRGQCGVGDEESNNVWDPAPVMGLGPFDASEGPDGKKGRLKREQDRPIVSVSLGLQHGLALDDAGNLYSWGKGNRGQLGVLDPGADSADVLPDTEYAAVRVADFLLPAGGGIGIGGAAPAARGGGGGKEEERGRLSPSDSRVVRMSAGMNRSAAVTASNHAWVWGKNVRPADPEIPKERGRPAGDALLPVPIRGLPPNLRIADVSCGSHHTAVLMEDGSVYCVGVTTDTVEPIVDAAVQIVPPGVVEMPVRQFSAHFDRTTIVGRDGRQVLEVQLWSHEELQDGAWFEPTWVEDLTDGGRSGVQSVHRGWLHTIVVTDD